MNVPQISPKAQLEVQQNANGLPVKETPEPIDPKNLEAIALLDSWDHFTEEEIQEQRETWAFLKRALDEDRLSPDRKLF